MALSEKQMSDIKKILVEKDSELWLYIQFIYYCYLRPNEVRQLRESYICLENSQIYIPGRISKNGKEGYVTIPESFRRVIAETKEFNSPGEYVFESRNKENPVSINVIG